MATKLYVGGLSYSVNDDQLREMFEAAGKVESAQVIVDRFSSQSKGFGFVEMGTEEEAQSAIKELNGKEIGGRPIVVNAARPQEKRNSHGPSNKFNNNRGPRY
ncbi:MAG TPA: RNA-binding protein [Candidatus Saccharimonadales bacterium]|nr:RNA-binding protein [Candidatus Saccharimonadales bacterium]